MNGGAFMKKSIRKTERFPKKQTRSFPKSVLQVAQRESEGYTGVEDTKMLEEMAKELNPDDFKE